MSADGPTSSPRVVEPGAIGAPSTRVEVVGSALVEAPAPQVDSKRRFLADNPGCAVPSGIAEWSWARLRRVSGLRDKAVVLTLDVGAKLPNLELLLTELRKLQVHATIFLYTAELERSPRAKAILASMIADGHEFGNHTFSHKDLTKLETEGALAEIDRVEAFVQSMVKASTRPYFREPLLATNDSVDALIKQRCYRSVWFTIDTGDWREKVTADDIVENVFSYRGKPREIEAGSIFIFHGSQKENLVALPRVITRLQNEGFGFLTLSEALAQSSPTPSP